MDTKSKIAVIVSVLISAGLGYFAYQQNYELEKGSHAQDMEAARREAEGLNSDLRRARSEAKNMRNKLSSMERELDAMLRERDDWRNKYDVIIGEKDGLMKRIEELERQKQRQPVVVAQPASVVSKNISQSDHDDSFADKGDSYWAMVLRDKARLAIEQDGLKQRLEQLNIRVEKLTKENNDLNAEMNRFNQIKSDLQRQVAYNEKLSRTLSEELVREKNDKKVFVEQLDKIKRDYMVMQQQLKESTDEKLVLRKQIQELSQEKQVLTRRIAEMDQTLQDRMSEIIRIKDEWTAMRSQAAERDAAGAKSKVVELPAIVVKSQQPGEVTLKERGSVSGAVLAVNQENNFVVIDLGESSGIKENDALDVYRQGAHIGSIKVIQVRRDISAADIIYIKSGKEIKVGDKVSNK
ncbi:MAG: hypothetical protein ACE5GG_02835 [Candidatus Omnitrophota bacterium]